MCNLKFIVLNTYIYDINALEYQSDKFSVVLTWNIVMQHEHSYQPPGFNCLYRKEVHRIQKVVWFVYLH